MTQVERIGISVEKKLLSNFDKLITKLGYQNRSEAIRDLIRDRLSTEQIKNPDADAIAAVCLVYDHHAANFVQKLTGLQHNHLLDTISSMHIHLDSHDCMEIIVLKGKVGEINKMAEKIVSLKGVKLGKINLIANN